MAMVCTHVAAAAASMLWTLLESKVNKSKPNSVGTVTGMVAGLAAVTPASGYIGPESEATSDGESEDGFFAFGIGMGGSERMLDPNEPRWMRSLVPWSGLWC